MTASMNSLRSILERYHSEPNAANEAVLRSTVLGLQDPSLATELLADAIDCLPLVDSILEAYESGAHVWRWNALVGLVEALLANGLDRKADAVASHLRRMKPHDVYAARLWAYSVTEPVQVVRRFAIALKEVEDKEALSRDAREFAGRSDDPEVSHLLERLLPAE